MRTTACFTVLALLAASAIATPPVHAGISIPVAHSLPHHVIVVGADAQGTPDPLGRFQVEVRSSGGDPWRNGLIFVDLSGTPDIAMCTTQSNRPELTGCFSSGPGTGALTDVNSTATLTITGHANRATADPGAPSLRIYCDGILIGTLTVAVLDQDGGGLGASDLSLWLQDYFSSQYFERSDFDGNGALGTGDLSVFLAAYLAGGSTQNCATTCP